MVASVTTFAFEGVEARPVDVQCQMTGGQPAFIIVGLPDKSVSEAKERIMASFAAFGLGVPPKRITVNLAPADLRKEGSHYDLPIALALMAEMGAIPRDALDGYAVMGEMNLDSSIAATLGALPAAVAANAMDYGLICPESSGPEAAWAGGTAQILAPKTIMQLVNHFKGTQLLTAPKPGDLAAMPQIADLIDVKGQESAKRALEISAAGGHNLLMLGPPGSGKSMLAARLAGLLPPLSAQEMLDVSMIQSMAGMLKNGTLSRARPFRAPHHSASMAAMVGGGMRAKPGEVSLAHNGVLFLDELPEFNGQVLDSLRQPLETGDVVIARANAHIRYRAEFQLIAAMNPCKCGYGKASGRACGRGANCEEKYQSRISGPFLDRLDIAVELPPVTAMDLAKPSSGEESMIVAKRIARARLAQEARIKEFADSTQNPFSAQALDASAPKISSINAKMPDRYIQKFAIPDTAGQAMLIKAAETSHLSARAYTRTLRVARTLADLEGSTIVKRPHIAEAISYRRKEPAAMGIGAQFDNAQPHAQHKSNTGNAPF